MNVPRRQLLLSSPTFGDRSQTPPFPPNDLQQVGELTGPHLLPRDVLQQDSNTPSSFNRKARLRKRSRSLKSHKLQTLRLSDFDTLQSEDKPACKS